MALMSTSIMSDLSSSSSRTHSSLPLSDSVRLLHFFNTSSSSSLSGRHHHRSWAGIPTWMCQVLPL
ncbi:hypothetical protein NFJ02_05g122520 [Pycnococcus provasolii]